MKYVASTHSKNTQYVRGFDFWIDLSYNVRLR